MPFITGPAESIVRPYLRSSPFLTVGASSDSFAANITTISNGELADLVKQAEDSGSDGIWLRRGTYNITRPIQVTKSGFRIYGSLGAVVNIAHSDSVGAVNVATGIEGVEVAGITFQADNPVSGQSVLRFGANGSQHVVRNCKFFIHPSQTYQAVTVASPMRCIDMQQVTGKIIEGNVFLPYIGVIPIWLEAGNGGNVQFNRVHNGIVTDLDQLVAATTFPFSRPCKIGIYMKNERQGWVHHNQFWALGDTVNGQSMDAVIQYDYDRAAMGGLASECGHMEISHNMTELCYAPRQIWGRGLQYSKIEGNNLGVSAGVMIANGAGEGGICLEEGITVSDLSRFCTIKGNNLHNNGLLNTDAASIYLGSADNIAVFDNHCCNLFCRYAVYIDDVCTNIAVRNLMADFNAAATNNFAVRITGASTNRITIGEVTAVDADSASGSSLVNNDAGGSQIIVNGLGKIGTGAYAVPINTDTADTLSTNIRMST